MKANTEEDIREEMLRRIKIETAFCEGQRVLCKEKGASENKWVVKDPTFCFGWELFDYKVDPEPREWWVNFFKDGCFSFYDDQESAQSSAHDRPENFLRVAVHVREVIDG